MLVILRNFYIGARYVEVPLYLHSKFLAAFIGFTY